VIRNQKPKNRNQQPKSVVIIANGKFPEHEIPLKALTDADIVVCCDGATIKVDGFGITPTAIVGDLDSLGTELKIKYQDRLFPNPDQETNDLTKAVQWCLDRKYTDVNILGATGLRDDHTLGNISLITRYAKMGVNVRMVTDSGYFIPLMNSCKVESFKGQQVSIFSQNNKTLITTNNLKYPINDKPLDELWMGTLNESLGDWFRLDFHPGPLIIFASYLESTD
jgi:thiamine pyrophosphokinase